MWSLSIILIAYFSLCDVTHYVFFEFVFVGLGLGESEACADLVEVEETGGEQKSNNPIPRIGE